MDWRVALFPVLFLALAGALWLSRARDESRRKRDIANARWQGDEIHKPDGIIEIPPGAVSVTLTHEGAGGGGSDD